MALNETSKEFISLKKLQGKAHTSNNKGLANEALSSGLTVSAKTVFSTDIPGSPTATHYAVSGGSVQYVRLSASFIAGSDTVAGRHAFALQLPDDYEAPDLGSGPSAANNPFTGKGTAPFEDETVDILIVNQILEHCKEIFWIFHELTRVLKDFFACYRLKKFITLIIRFFIGKHEKTNNEDFEYLLASFFE